MPRLVQLKRIAADCYKVDAVFSLPSFLPSMMKTKERIIEAPGEFSDADIKSMLFKGGVWTREGNNGNGSAPLPAYTPVAPPPPDIASSELTWAGYFYDSAGYAKANRELILRVSNTIRVKLESGFTQEVLVGGPVDNYTRMRLDALRKVTVSNKAPFLRLFMPQEEDKGSHRITFTMMETETVHPGLVALINNSYQECWVPSEWNRGTFEESGVSVPIHVLPLGVNQHTFRPGTADMPLAVPITGGVKGKMEIPRGFTFLSVFQLSFRKGIDVLLRAFEAAFAQQPDVSLVLFVGAKSPEPTQELLELAAKYTKNSNVYYYGKVLSEKGLADLYRASNAYVSTSRGEGWNLPVMEAGACGVPVILPKNSAHLDYATDDNAFVVEPDGFEVHPAGHNVSHWFAKQLFSKFGDKAHGQLVEQLRTLRSDSTLAGKRAANMRELVRSKYTWDLAAGHVVDRLLGL